MKYQPKYKVDDNVLYNSLLSAGASNGVVRKIDNNNFPHLYTIEPDAWKGKVEVVKEQDIFKKL